MNILLITPVDREFMPPTVFPLGAGYVAAALERAGHRVSVVDLNGNRDGGLDELLSTLEKERFDWIGISSIITQYKTVKELSARVRNLAPDTPLIHGGPGPTSYPELYIKHAYANAVAMGEGEHSCLELCRALEQGALSTCPGLSLPENGKAAATACLSPIADLDGIPFPSWELFPVEQYIKHNLYKPSDRKRGINIMTSRGCPGKCTYCMRNFGNAVRFRSVDNILEEIRLFHERHTIDHVHFLDDTLATDKERLSRLCDALMEKSWDMTWSANARVTQVNPELLARMAASGCRYISYGIESAHPDILKEMRKGITPERAAKAIQWTREAGITPRGYFMIGFPSETERTIRASVEFCKANLVGGEFFFVTPFPGTAIWDNAKSRGLITNDDVYLEIAGEVRNFVVNITQSLDNDTLFTLKQEAEQEIRDHLEANGIRFKESTREDPWEAAKTLPKF